MNLMGLRSPGCGLGRVLVYLNETFGLGPSKRKEGSEQKLPLHKNTPTSFFVKLGTLHIGRRMNWGG